MASARSIDFFQTSSFSKLNIIGGFRFSINNKLSSINSFVASLGQVHGVEMQRLPMQFRRRDRSVASLKFPGKHRSKVVIVAQCFAFGGLMFLAKMRAAGFVAR